MDTPQSNQSDMKIAVFSDIHANFPALQRITQEIEIWQPDYVVVAGDIVNRGPKPLECLNWIQQKQAESGWLLIRGNHEDYVISRSYPDAPKKGPTFELHKASYWTYERLNFDVEGLKSMPLSQNLKDPNGKLLRFLHASERNTRDGIYPETSDKMLRQKLGLTNNHSRPPVLFVCGHTHRPLVRYFGGTLVVNVGSAGLPFDGDHRIAYAQLTYNDRQWQAKIIRVEYDMKTAEKDFYTTGYLENGGPLVGLVLRELKEAKSHLYHWATRYQKSIITGKISMAASVSNYLHQTSDQNEFVWSNTE